VARGRPHANGHRVCATAQKFPWSWKDEHHLVEAVELGIFDEQGGAEVRAEGERVIAARPWPTGWEGWRAPDHSAPLPLPDAWEAVA
jgi:hypothetical protein